MEFPEKTTINHNTITIVPRYCETDQAEENYSVYCVQDKVPVKFIFF